MSLGLSLKCISLMIWFLTSFVPFFSESAFGIQGADRMLFLKYLNANEKGLHQMQSASGWPIDRMGCTFVDGSKEICKPLDEKASPTNIGLDLLYQLELLLRPPAGLISVNKTDRRERLLKSLSSLARAPYHSATGLFYSWYDTKSGRVLSKNVSAIDNYHLALGLWTVAQSLPEGDPLQKLAQVLFERLDFTVFWDAHKSLLAGNLRFEESTNRWSLESYRFGFFGSETRTLYFAGSAMRIFKGVGKLPVDSILSNQQIETLRTRSTHLLKTWDGGTFQLFLPQLLIDEAQLSPTLKKAFVAQARRMLDRGLELPEGIPAGYSASESLMESAPGLTSYSGQFGDLETTASANGEAKIKSFRDRWESVVTLHASFLSAEWFPSEILERLQHSEKLGMPKGLKLFSENYGWFDGVMVAGALKGQVVPVQLSPHQLMSQLCILKILSKDHSSPSSRALMNNADVMNEIRVIYQQVEKKLAPFFKKAAQN